MPKDYRAEAEGTSTYAAGEVPGTFASGLFYEERFEQLRKALLEEALANVAPEGPAAQALLRAASEVASVGREPEARKAVLLKMVRESHPDRNTGREEEMLPVFLYVQKLRENV